MSQWSDFEREVIHLNVTKCNVLDMSKLQHFVEKHFACDWRVPYQAKSTIYSLSESYDLSFEEIQNKLKTHKIYFMCF